MSVSVVTQDLLFIQLFLSHVGDGELGQDELDFIEDCLVALGGAEGMDRADAHALLNDGRRHYLADMAQDPASAVAAFQERVDRLAATFQGQRDVLAHLYQDLVRLSSMDGRQGRGERDILDGIRTDWGLT